MLRGIGEKFQSVGMCEEAVDVFSSVDVKAAVDCCVMLNQWKDAVRLAREHDFPQIESLLAKYASMLEQGNRLKQSSCIGRRIRVRMQPNCYPL